MEIIKNPSKEDCKENSYQSPFPHKYHCSCENESRLLMIINDKLGELAKEPPKRNNGFPIHPHDSCSFALYMCEKCGEVTVIWNQS